MSNTERVREQIEEIILEVRQYLISTEFAPEPFKKPVDIDMLKVQFPDKILAIPGLRVEAEDQSLPLNPYPPDYKELPAEFQEEATGEDVYLQASNGFEKGMRYMLKAGWVKVERQKRIQETPAPFEEVTESEGYCRQCHQWAELGNGLCVGCWDAKSEQMLPYQNRIVKPGRVRRAYHSRIRVTL